MGIYYTDGRIRLTEVSGSSITGIYAADGSWNVYDATGTTSFVGIYHPCGAFNVTVVTDPAAVTTRYAANGSMNIYVTDRNLSTAALNGYDVLGTLSGAPATNYLLLEDNFKIILEDGSGYLLLES